MKLVSLFRANVSSQFGKTYLTIVNLSANLLYADEGVYVYSGFSFIMWRILLAAAAINRRRMALVSRFIDIAS